MQVLRAAKNNQPVTSELAAILICALEVQVLGLFLIDQNSSIYSRIFEFISKDSPVSFLIIINFTLNLLEIIYLLSKIIKSYFKTQKKNNAEKSGSLRFLQIKHYLVFIQMVNINSLGFKNSQIIIKCFGAFNICFAMFELFTLQSINISYRFIQKNYIRRKNSSIIPWLLILPITFTMNFYSSMYSSFFLFLRAVVQIFFNFNNIQCQIVRKLQWFFPLLSIVTAMVVILDAEFKFSIFGNNLSISFLLFFSIYCCNTVSSTLKLQALKWHINRSQYILDSKNKAQVTENQPAALISQNQINQIILQLRIMIKVYISRIKKDVFLQNKSTLNADNYDNWWNFFDRFILDHKVFCQNVNCVCLNLAFRDPNNKIIENKIFVDKAYALIRKLQTQSSKSVNKVKIVENYFLIQIQQRPLKTYYQLIKLFAGQLNQQEMLQVQNLIIQTRDIFKEFFIRQKVKNTQLEVQPVFQFQIKMKDMRLRMNDMAIQYRKFYQIFASSFVQMDALKIKTKLLTNFKKRYIEQLDYCLANFDKSIELMNFCMIYFRFFDEYTNRLERIESKALALYESFYNPYNEYKKKQIDIFNPHYGAIKADLVFSVGRIITITKNLCHTLGFTHQQLSGQKINKLMPQIFAKHHDKFLRTLIQKGQVKTLRLKQKIYYARAANKFIVPITVRLKIDYSSFQSLSAVTFLRPTPTKSQFIILNNYGKIQEISSGVYNKIFRKVFNDEIWKVKRLCLSKMILSLNYYIKDAKQNDENVHQGLFLTTDNENSLMQYYKFPELGISYKPRQGSQTFSKSNASIQQSSSFSMSTNVRSLDLTQDMSKYIVDMKQSLKQYFKKLDTTKVIGFRVSYKLQDYITSQFKCKILEIISIRDEMIKSQLKTSLNVQITDVAEYFGLEDHQYLRFKSIRTQNFFLQQQSDYTMKKTLVFNDEDDLSSKKQISRYKVVNGQRGESETSSMISMNQVQKKKQTIITAFEQQIIVSQNLQYGLTILILVMAFILIVISIFSIAVKGNYVNLQHDNLIITNFRINFLLRLGIQELYKLYSTFNIIPPSFLLQKKLIVNDKMKQHLIKSVKWIDISGDSYANKISLEYIDQNYKQNRTTLQLLNNMYSTFVAAQQQGRYLTDNYVVIANNLLAITSREQILITNQSNSYKLQIHIIVAIYSGVMIFLVIVALLLRRLALQKQNKIIDFLPFLKTQTAKKRVRFYQLFFEFNKQSQNVDSSQIDQLALESQKQEKSSKLISSQKNKIKKLINSITETTSSKLIRVVKNQKSGITFKQVSVGILVFGLCVFVIFFSEFFFAQIHSKFQAYLTLKNSAFLVQLIPARITLLYFMNINKILHNQTTFLLPQSYTTLVHDRIFELQGGLADPRFYGIEMEKIISHHFDQEICNLVTCRYNADESDQIHDQQLFYLAYRYINAFDYMRKIIKKLPTYNDPRFEITKWIKQNNLFQILKSTEIILDLMKKNQQQITNLFTDQIINIGNMLLALSLTLIPILIVVLLLIKNKYIWYVSDRLDCTQNIYKHISWNMLSQNSYAITYFEDKLKNAKIH